MSEINEGSMAGTAHAAPAAVVVVKEDTAKEIAPVRFFDSGQPTQASKDFRPGVAQTIVPTVPRSITVNPGGEPAGSPSLLDRIEDVEAEVLKVEVPVVVVPEVVVVTEVVAGADAKTTVPPMTPTQAVAVKTETPKDPAKA